MGELDLGIPFLNHDTFLHQSFCIIFPLKIKSFGKIVRIYIPNFLLFLCVIKKKYFRVRS